MFLVPGAGIREQIGESLRFIRLGRARHAEAKAEGNALPVILGSLLQNALGEGLGGLPALIGRSAANLAAITVWVENSAWAGFLAEDSSQRSSTSVCLKITDPWFEGLDGAAQAAIPKKIDALLDAENASFDINGYRDAPPGLRIWAGATVETADLEALFPWLDWAYATVKAQLAEAA